MNTDYIFDIKNNQQFTETALAIFQYQYNYVPVYNRFCNLLKINPKEIDTIEKIPFLPIQFFKLHLVVSEEKTVDTNKITFSSSGTTGSITSKHIVTDLNIYEKSFCKAFGIFYGDIENYAVLALLPSYLERQGSSLVYMVDSLIKKSKNSNSGFYLNDLEKLSGKIRFLEAKGQKTILLGVSYALLDLVEKESFNLKHTVVMETGGMKGMRKEMVREELHNILKKGFTIEKIHSEYGMTELLSQAYSKGEGVYNCPPWMKVLTRDTENALSYVEKKSGGISVIDLANVNSCSFIATQDLGKVHENGDFEILGRFDESDIRGCNLMVQ